jgi:hypothetical protein
VTYRSISFFKASGYLYGLMLTGIAPCIKGMVRSQVLTGGKEVGMEKTGEIGTTRWKRQGVRHYQIN